MRLQSFAFNIMRYPIIILLVFAAPSLIAQIAYRDRGTQKLHTAQYRYSVKRCETCGGAYSAEYSERNASSTHTRNNVQAATQGFFNGKESLNKLLLDTLNVKVVEVVKNVDGRTDADRAIYIYNDGNIAKINDCTLLYNESEVESLLGNINLNSQQNKFLKGYLFTKI